MLRAHGLHRWPPTHSAGYVTTIEPMRRLTLVQRMLTDVWSSLSCLPSVQHGQSVPILYCTPPSVSRKGTMTIPGTILHA